MKMHKDNLGIKMHLSGNLVKEVALCIFKPTLS